MRFKLEADGRGSRSRQAGKASGQAGIELQTTSNTKRSTEKGKEEQDNKEADPSRPEKKRTDSARGRHRHAHTHTTPKSSACAAGPCASVCAKAHLLPGRWRSADDRPQRHRGKETRDSRCQARGACAYVCACSCLLSVVRGGCWLGIYP